MRVILDHCVPRGLLSHLIGHEAATVGSLGLADTDDGPLLEALVSRCDGFVTVDRKLPYQQQLDTRPFATFILRAKSNRLADLIPLVPELLSAPQSPRRG